MNGVDHSGKRPVPDRKIEMVGRKYRLGEVPSDFAYWQQQPCHVRLATVTQIRAEYHGWRPGVGERLQRVYRVVKRP